MRARPPRVSAVHPSHRGRIVVAMDERLRLRSVGAPVARSMLLTVLGEYVAPANLEVYRHTLVSSLENLGYTASAARQGVARSAAGGWLRSSRVGRRTRMALTQETHAMLRAGYPRIFGFGEPWSWDGRWLLVVLRVPENRREVRDRLRTDLAWAGFGSLGGGLWVSPHVDREREVLAAANGNAHADVLAFAAQHVPDGGEPEGVVAQAWDLPGTADHYHGFIADFKALRPRTPQATFVAQTTMVHAWRKFPFVDPELPDELLPRGWPRNAARRLFRDRHERWQDAAESFFASLGT